MQWIGKKLIKKTGNPEAMNHLTERIAITIQRGNAASVLSALPQVELSSLFYI